MKLIKIVLLTAILAVSGCKSISATSSGQEHKPLPGEAVAALRYSPTVSKGKLSNGLSYYVSENKNPKERVYIRLVINAGSMNEAPDQRGVAHIVEHMAFNGSKNFPGNSVITELEKAGMKFGVDINAFTDFENTVYKLNLPDNKPATMELALKIVADWTQHVTMLKGDLSAERGIVLEEWRARLGPMLRLGNQKSQFEMAGSRYVTRDPIGEVDTIMNVSQQRVADFYNKWYRPDNMSVVVVGDINADSVVNQLESLLGSQPARTTKLAEIDYSIPLEPVWRTGSVYEPGMTTPSVELSFLSQYEIKETKTQYKKDLAAQIVTRLLNIRFQHWEQNNSLGINSLSFHSSTLGRETSQAVFSAYLSESNFDQVTEALFGFIAEVSQNGFSSEEFNGEIGRLKRLNERNHDKKTYSIDLATDLMLSAATQQIHLSEEDKYQLNKAALEQLTLQDVNHAFEQTIANKSRLLVKTQSRKQATPSMDATQLAQSWDQHMAEKQDIWQVEEVVAQLPDLDLRKGSIKKERVWAKHRITEYRLSNGSKLVYRYSDQNPGQVHFKALTRGGLRSVSDQEFQALRIAGGLVDDNGVGELTLTELQTLFRGNPIVMSSIVDDYRQGYSGWAKKENLQQMFTLFRLKLAESPVSDKVLSKYKSEMLQNFAADAFDSEGQFTREVSRLRFPETETIYSVTEDDISSLNQHDVSDIYQRYIAGKTDFTYFVVGDISARELEPMVSRFLASLPVNKSERREDVVMPASPQQRFVQKTSPEPRAEVELYLTLPGGWRPDNAYYLSIGGELVQEELRYLLREQVSGVYGVTSWFWQNPEEKHAEGRIRFTCDPSRVDELILLTNQVLADVIENGFKQQILHNKLTQSADQLDRLLRSDLGMLDALERSYMMTDSPALIEAEIRANKSATLSKVESISKDFLKNAHRFEAVLLPEAE